MKYTLYLLPLLLLTAACRQENAGLKSIREMESTFEANPTAESAKVLLEAYEKYIAEHPEDTESNADLLNRAATVQVGASRFAAAVQYLKDALRKYPDAPRSPDNALFLAAIYREKLNNPQGAKAIYQLFPQVFPGDKKIDLVPDSLRKGDIPVEQQIENLRFAIYNDTTARIQYNPASEYIGLCEVYCLLNPKGEKSADFLLEAAKAAGYVRSFPKALELYDWFYSSYPEHPKASSALFMMGFIYENELRNIDQARAIYEDFLAKYPNDDFADDAKFLLENLGRSEEEITREFEGGSGG